MNGASAGSASDGIDHLDVSTGRCYSSSDHHRVNESRKDCCAEPIYSKEMEDFKHKLWLSFQNTASAITHLYREKAQGHDRDEMWSSFQNAAEILTIMYREGIDGCKVLCDLVLQYACQRRNREILAWANKKKRRYIRREELVTYLCGQAVPTLKTVGTNQTLNSDDGLQTFHEAVSMNGLNGAMADIKFDGDNSPRCQSPPRACQQDLPLFLAEEFRLRKDSCSGSAPASRKRHSSFHFKSLSPKRKK